MDTKEVAKNMVAADRKEIKSLITRREQAILKALGEELSCGSGGAANKSEMIAQKVRAEKGIVYSVHELEQLIKSVDTQINHAVGEHIAAEKQQIDILESDTDEEYYKRERALREKHKKENAELNEWHELEKKKLQDRIKTARERIILEKAPHLIQEKAKYEDQLAKTRRLEMEVGPLVKQRMVMIKAFGSRLESIIRDASNRAQEQLWTVETREEAAKLLNLIPTVSEALEMCQTADGIQNLMHRIDPKIAALPMPNSTPPNEKNITDVSVRTIDAVDAVVLPDEVVEGEEFEEVVEEEEAE